MVEASYVDFIEPVLEPCMKGQQVLWELSPEYNVEPALTVVRELSKDS